MSMQGRTKYLTMCMIMNVHKQSIREQSTREKEATEYKYVRWKKCNILICHFLFTLIYVICVRVMIYIFQECTLAASACDDADEKVSKTHKYHLFPHKYNDDDSFEAYNNQRASHHRYKRRHDTRITHQRRRLKRRLSRWWTLLIFNTIHNTILKRSR